MDCRRRVTASNATQTGFAMPENQRNFAGLDLPDTSPPARYVPSDERVEGRDFVCCAGCDGECEISEVVNNDDGAAYHEDCYNDIYTRCTACNDEIEMGGHNECTNEDGESFCMPCYDDAYRRCDACGCECSAESAETVNCTTYCADCYNDRYTHCCGCNDVMHFDDVAYTDEYDGECYCSQCAPSDEDDDSAEWATGRNVEGVTFDKIRARRRFGVELEISGCTGHSGLRGQTVFGAKYDGSLTSGKEFVSPVMQGDEGIAATENLCAFGKAHGWSVDNSCGYHLHVDCGDYDQNQLHAIAVGYAATEALWKRFVSKKRGDNSYCRKFLHNLDHYRNSNFQSILRNTDCRYYWLNWQAYNQHQTVEIRLHSGTVNAAKIVNWIKAHTRFVEWCAGRSVEEVYTAFAGKSVEEQFTVLAGIFDEPALADYYAARAAKHGHPVKSEEPAVAA